MPNEYRNIFYIYIDEFQPFHKRNKDFYENVKSKNPTRTFINCIGFDLNENLPFSIEETEKIFQFFKINNTNVIYTQNKHDISQIKRQFYNKKIEFDEKLDAIVFIESIEDYNPKIAFDIDGYIQLYNKHKSNIKPANKNSYIIYSGSDVIKENDKKLDTLNDIKKYFNSLTTDEQKKKFITDMYPNPTSEIYNMIDDELSGRKYTIHPSKEDEKSKEDKSDIEVKKPIDNREADQDIETDVTDEPEKQSDQKPEKEILTSKDSDQNDSDEEKNDEEDEFKKKIKEMVNKYLKENETTLFNFFRNPEDFENLIKKNQKTFKKSIDYLNKSNKIKKI